MRRSDRELKDRKEIEEIILKCRTCHVAMYDGDFPYVVPLNFGYRFIGEDTLELFFHSALEGKKIEILKVSNKVCFEITDEGKLISAESPCNMGFYYSSVIGFGEAVFITETAEKCECLSAIVSHQAGINVDFTEKQAETVCVFKIVSTDFCGKRKPKPQS